MPSTILFFPSFLSDKFSFSNSVKMTPPKRCVNTLIIDRNINFLRCAYMEIFSLQTLPLHPLQTQIFDSLNIFQNNSFPIFDGPLPLPNLFDVLR